MPRKSSGVEWINCTHPTQLRTADVRRIISVNAQLSRRRSGGKVAPKRLKAEPSRPRISNRTLEKHADEILEDGASTPESVPSLVRTSSVNSDEVDTEVGKDSKESMAVATSPVSWASRSTSPYSFLDSGQLDPFATSIVPISKDMNDLLLHLIFIMVPPKRLCEQQPWHQFCPVISMWARTAVGPITLPEHYLSTMAILSNAMLQYAVCGLAATHLHFLQGHVNYVFDTPFKNRPMLVDCLYYQGKVMEELHNHLMGKDDFADLCSVVSTMCLLAMSVYFGVKPEIMVHIKGINDLVRESGGWDVIPLDVAQIYLCTIYLSAIWTCTIPPEPPHPISDLESSEALLMSQDRPSSLLHIGEALLELDLDDELVDIIRQTQYISRYREYCLGHGCRVTPQEVEIFTLRRLDVEYRLMKRTFGDECAEHSAICISLLIFSVVNLELITVTAGPFRTLTALLKRSLERPSPIPGPVLLWMLFIGAHIAIESTWFVSRIAQLSQQLGIKSWDDARNSLTRTFYVERIYEEPFRKVWTQACSRD